MKTEDTMSFAGYANLETMIHANLVGTAPLAEREKLKTLVGIYTVSKHRRMSLTSKEDVARRRISVRNEDPNDPLISLGDVSLVPPEGQMCSEGGPRDDRHPLEEVADWAGRKMDRETRKRINYVVDQATSDVAVVLEYLGTVRELCATDLPSQ